MELRLNAGCKNALAELTCLQRFNESVWNGDVQAPVVASCLQHADAGSAIFAKSVDENTSGGTGSDNDVVLRGIGHVDRMPASLPIAKRDQQLHNPSRHASHTRAPSMMPVA